MSRYNFVATVWQRPRNCLHFFFFVLNNLLISHKQDIRRKYVTKTCTACFWWDGCHK